MFPWWCPFSPSRRADSGRRCWESWRALPSYLLLEFWTTDAYCTTNNIIGRDAFGRCHSDYFRHLCKHFLVFLRLVFPHSRIPNSAAICGLCSHGIVDCRNYWIQEHLGSHGWIVRGSCHGGFDVLVGVYDPKWSDHEGFEHMERRLPDISKIRKLIGYEPLT